MGTVDNGDLRTIITKADGTETLVRVAEQLGQQLARQLTTSQIRALFGEVRQIEGEWSMGEDGQQRAVRRLILLKPKMAYRAKKESGKGVEDLVNVLDPAVSLVISEKDPNKQGENFQRFVEFFEAILAYHKANGGR